VKLPAVAIAAAFACGIATGLFRGMTAHAGSRELVVGFFIAAGAMLGLGFFFVARGYLWAAGCAALFSWAFLGFVGAYISQQPRATDHVTSLIENGGSGYTRRCAGTVSCGMSPRGCRGALATK